MLEALLVFLTINSFYKGWHMRKTENLVQLDPSVEENLIHKSSEVELVTPGWDIIDQAEVDAAGP